MSRLHSLFLRLKEMDRASRLRWMWIAAAVLALAVLLSAARDRVALLEKKRLQKEKELAELITLRQQFRSAKNAAAGKSPVRPDDSPAKAVEETGIGRNLQVKPVKGDDIPGFVEDAAEIRIDSLSANEAVNLLYRLEKGSRPVRIKKAAIKSRFDDPAKLDLTLTLGLLKPAGGAR